MLPGVIAVLTGVCMLLAKLFKLINAEDKTTTGSTQSHDIENWVQPFLLLLFCMTLAGLFQFVGGMLADRYPLKPVYLALYLVQVPLLVFAATAGGISLVLVMGLAVSFGIGSLPTENMLLARYTPDRHHGVG